MVKFHITTNPIITQFVNVKPGTIFRLGSGGQCYIRTQRPMANYPHAENFNVVRLADGMKMKFDPAERVYIIDNAELHGTINA